MDFDDFDEEDDFGVSLSVPGLEGDGDSGEEGPRMPNTKGSKKKTKPKEQKEQKEQKTKRRPGRPKKQVQETVVGGSNQALLEANKQKNLERKMAREGKTSEGSGSIPQFEKETDPVSLPRTLSTNELIEKLGWDGEDPEEEEDDFNEPKERDEKELLPEMIDYYEDLWTKYPHLSLVPELKKKDFSPAFSTVEEVEKEIKRVEDLGEKPFKDKLYSQLWYMFSIALGTTVKLTPLAEVLEPEPSLSNPVPASLSQELRSEEVIQKAIPVMEDVFNAFPMLEYLGKLGDPRVQLAYAISNAAFNVYQKNTNPSPLRPRP